MAEQLPAVACSQVARDPTASRWSTPIALLMGVMLLFGTAADQSTPSSVAESPAAGPIAAGLSEVLSGAGPYALPDLKVRLISQGGDILDLDQLVGEKPVLIFYFSASCHHCSQVAPELAEMAERLRDAVDFLGIASGSNGIDAISAFQQDYGLKFPVHKDFSRRFASRNQAVSTPTVLLVRKVDAGGFETLMDFRPFYAGASLPAEIRIRALLGQDPWQAFTAGRYFGAKACGSCHLEEYRSWQLTHHSIAYWTLHERKVTDKTECVRCHVTGLGEAGGFVLGEDGSPLADVTCEACHGAGGPHPAGTVRPQEPSASSLCVTCHDREHSVRFEVERALPHVDHFRAATMSPEAYKEARRALLEGRAPKPLLAFPQGRNLGSQACLSCHRKEHRHWTKSPHAKAMKTLAKRGATEDLACVSCHAVSRSDPPESTGDFHPEGVSCEACHGPGEQHVAAEGGKDNIVGLGDSCPECVIEGICTRCHTPEQDADWELQPRLDAIRHHP